MELYYSKAVCEVTTFILSSKLCVCFADEGALVRAAQNLGFVFSGRTPDSVIVEMVRGTGQTGTGTLSDVKYTMDQAYFYFGSDFTAGDFYHEHIKQVLAYDHIIRCGISLSILY